MSTHNICFPGEIKKQISIFLGCEKQLINRHSSETLLLLETRYSIYPKYWDTLIAYRTCSKI